MAVKLESGHCEISEDVPSFSVGEQFTNFSEFESKLNSRLALTNEKLRIGVGSTKMTVSCGKKEKEQQPRDDIVYRYVEFVCRHGGIHKSRGCQKRKRK